MAGRKVVGTVKETVEKFEARSSIVIDTIMAAKSTPLQDVTPGSLADLAYSLPSPVDTPYRTPSSPRSRQTSHTYEDMSPGTTPPPIPSGTRKNKRISDESIPQSIDETLPLSDPRRFTPTLHASLVSEILSLRRDAENRAQDIERLEQSLHEAHVQNQTANDNLHAANRETRQVRRQMQILEGGTLSAIDELAKERDDALGSANDLRLRLEQVQKKSKSHEDGLNYAQSQWQKDKEEWSGEKRGLETKIHIVEGRLKVVLSEVAKLQLPQNFQELQSPKRSQSRASVMASPQKRPDSVHVRRQSNGSQNSDHAGGRTSALSFANGDGINLADELGLEDIEEDYLSEGDELEFASPDREEPIRPTSRVSIKARRILGLPIDLGEYEQRDRTQTPDTKFLQGILFDPTHQSQYVDTSTQYTRPSSPVLSPEAFLERPVQRNRESVDTMRASKALSYISQDSAHFSVDTSDNAWEENLRNLPIMVSSACQTVEQLPSPPTTPKQEPLLATIVETIETREIAVQTDPQLPSATSVPGQNVAHRRTDTQLTNASTDLQIPTIAIIPPTSRPVTPDELAVKLPPRTKNVACQVECQILCDYNSKAIQTEEIRIDKRTMAPSAPIGPPPPIPATLPPSATVSKIKSQHLSKRQAPNAANSGMRRISNSQSSGPVNDDGPINESRREIGRPVRSSSMFAGFDEQDESIDFDDDVFQDDEFFDRPTTKFILSRGKILAATKDLDDIEETEAAVAAGKRFALEHIRRSEELDREIELDDVYAQLNGRQTSKIAKRLSSSKPNNMRRAALISSGTAAHTARGSLSSLGSGDTSKPPVSIPVRYSSARVGKSISDGGRSSRSSSHTSPTRHVRKVTKPGLRKTRSGPAMSPAASHRRVRSRSPPLDERVSIVPEMPNFRMPRENKEIPLRPAPSATSFRSIAPTSSAINGGTMISSSIVEGETAFDAQQTSVVDAIAQTMVGEWMFKYVRRRKSFGKPEKEWDPTKSVEEMSNSASSGVRHKRWVWLAPYERSVMWSSKQPTDGTSLLGKSGRKLTIKSVLDVKDDNPMPKGSILGPHFGRSILILTPQRALKFTTMSQERHYMWLTALSFLSHSPISMSDLAPMPPMPPENRSEPTTSPSASLGGSLRRRPIRDSIRIAKGTAATKSTFRSFTTDGIPTMSEYERPRTQEAYDPINDAAMPPVIRRYHNRNRSNTAPKPAPSTLRSFLSRDSGPAPPTASTVITGKESADRSLFTPPIQPSRPQSRRGSDVSAVGRPPLAPPISSIDSVPRFLDSASNSSHAASMTMRMDAFMADQQRQANARGAPARGSLRNLRLSRPSMRNLNDPSTSSWVQQDFNTNNFRDSISPPLQTPTDLRFSESTRGSSEAGYYRAL